MREVVRLLAEKMGRSLAEVSEDVSERPGQDAAYVIDSSKIRDETGWYPQVGFSEGLGGVVDWIDREWEAIQRENLNYVHKP